MDPAALLADAIAVYGAARVEVDLDGVVRSARGPGGGLVEAVEARGVVSLAMALSPGGRMILEDEGISLELRRLATRAILRAAWTDGPSYEEQIDLPIEAAPSPARRLEPVADPVDALHDPSLPLVLLARGLCVGEPSGQTDVRGVIPAVGLSDLGAPDFCTAHGVKAPYVAGDMAGAISSVDLVLAMSRAGFLAFYGSGGVGLDQVRMDVRRIQALAVRAPAGFNLLHNPNEPAIEEATVDIYLQAGCRRVSASAYMQLTPAVVRYRLTGIATAPDGEIVCPNKVFAKLSRPEVAEQFMRPAPQRILDELVAEGRITAAQAALGRRVPVAEDVVVEADSGGHTDRRPLVVMLPVIQRLRDRIQTELGYRVRVGAAGGLGDPTSVHAALCMGADFVLTGSINQACVESGTSDLVRSLLAEAGVADVATGPAPDMFELGAHVQVLSRGTMYHTRATRLYEVYKRYGAIEQIPEDERDKLEKTIFRRPLREVWDDTRAYWAMRDPAEVERAGQDPRHRMALCFRWYLGMTSRWARLGDADRKRDFQIWCGPSMGLFNDWVAGTWLADPAARRVAVVAHAILRGALVLRRVQQAEALGLRLPPRARWVLPEPPIDE